MARRVHGEGPGGHKGVLHFTGGLKATKLQDPRVARATTAATYLEQGKIWFPKKPWRDEWDTELVTFPHSKHDDQTDVLAYAALQIKQRRRRIRWVAPADPNLRKPSGITTPQWS